MCLIKRMFQQMKMFSHTHTHTHQLWWRSSWTVGSVWWWWCRPLWWPIATRMLVHSQQAALPPERSFHLLPPPGSQSGHSTAAWPPPERHLKVWKETFQADFQLTDTENRETQQPVPQSSSGAASFTHQVTKSPQILSFGSNVDLSRSSSQAEKLQVKWSHSVFHSDDVIHRTCEIEPRDFHASHFTLLTKSSMPGLGVLQGPWVACRGRRRVRCVTRKNVQKVPEGNSFQCRRPFHENQQTQQSHQNVHRFLVSFLPLHARTQPTFLFWGTNLLFLNCQKQKCVDMQLICASAERTDSALPVCCSLPRVYLSKIGPSPAPSSVT